MFFSSKSAQSAFSVSPSPFSGSMTKSAASHSESTFLVASTRILPRSPESSNPGVSIRTTGPKGRISIAFLTASVVVPGTEETSETLCPVMRLTSELFPALRRPKIPMWTRSPEGTDVKLIKIPPVNKMYPSGAKLGRARLKRWKPNEKANIPHYIPPHLKSRIKISAEKVWHNCRYGP